MALQTYFSILVLAFLLLSANASAVSLSCSIKPSCDSNETDILHMSDTSNGHAELPSQSNFNNVLCCKEANNLVLITNSTTNSSGTVFLHLSDSTNAMAEKSNQSNFNINVSISTPWPSTYNLSCDYNTTCATNQACLVSISDDTNAHIGDCSAFSTKICCSLVSLPGPSPPGEVSVSPLSVSLSSSSVFMNSSCGSNIISVASSGLAINGVHVAVVDNAMGGGVIFTGDTNSSGQVSFQGCGKSVNIETSGSGYQTTTATQTLVDCGSCPSTNVTIPQNVTPPVQPPQNITPPKTNATVPPTIPPNAGIAVNETANATLNAPATAQVNNGVTLTTSCTDCIIQVTGPDGKVMTLNPDKAGSAAFTPLEVGQYQIDLLRNGVIVKSVSLPVAAPQQPAQKPPSAPLPQPTPATVPSNGGFPWLIVLALAAIIVMLGACYWYMSKGSKKK